MCSKDHRLPVCGAALALLDRERRCGKGVGSGHERGDQTRAVASAREVDEASKGPNSASPTAGVFSAARAHEKVGFSAAGDLLQLSPGTVGAGARGRFSAYIAQDFLAIGALGTGRAGLVLGPVLPYVLGGLGVGFIGVEHNDTEMAYLGGGTANNESAAPAACHPLLIGRECPRTGIGVRNNVLGVGVKTAEIAR